MVSILAETKVAGIDQNRWSADLMPLVAVLVVGTLPSLGISLSVVSWMGYLLAVYVQRYRIWPVLSLLLTTAGSASKIGGVFTHLRPF